MKQIFRIMKLTTFLLFVMFLQVSAGVFSQNNGQLSLKAEKESVNNILKLIEEKSEYRFLFNSNNIDVERKTDLNCDSKSIEELLNMLFVGTNVRYRSFNNNYVLYAEDVAPNTSAQQPGKSVSGKVTDSSGTSFPGVSVVVKGTTIGNITDENGIYIIPNVPANSTLVFSFVGMKTQEISVGNKTTVNALMEEETLGIEEVVAIGYGTVKKADLTGAVSVVKADEFKNVSALSVGNALQGLVPGVNIRSSGNIGSEPVVEIRGLGNFTNNNPLYIIDGLPTTGNRDFNVNDIESIQILKDASAAAIYGSRAANGVIIIETKKGVSGEMKVN